MRNLTLIAAAALAAGCTGLNRDGAGPEPLSALASPPPAEAPYLSHIAVERNQPDDPPPTAVESALVWSEKYAQAVEQLAQVREAAQATAEAQRGLQDKIAALQAENVRLKQELQEANDLLVDVRQENAKWKENVLGYRDELRQAHQVELEALLKVLKLLGGEVVQPAAGQASAAGRRADAP